MEWRDFLLAVEQISAVATLPGAIIVASAVLGGAALLPLGPFRRDLVGEVFVIGGLGQGIVGHVDGPCLGLGEQLRLTLRRISSAIRLQ